MSQKTMVLEYIRQHGSISSNQARDALGCTRLAARIADLEKDGYTFSRMRDRQRNRFEQKVTFTRYSLRGDKDG